MYRRKIKGSETFFRLILSVNNSPALHLGRENVAAFRESTKLPPFFQTWSLAHSQSSRMLITFFRSEVLGRVVQSRLTLAQD